MPSWFFEPYHIESKEYDQICTYESLGLLYEETKFPEGFSGPLLRCNWRARCLAAKHFKKNAPRGRGFQFASSLPYYCTPPVSVPDVIGVPVVWRQKKNKTSCMAAKQKKDTKKVTSQGGRKKKRSE